jgi:hypothetical protein
MLKPTYINFNECILMCTADNKKRNKKREAKLKDREQKIHQDIAPNVPNNK